MTKYVVDTHGLVWFLEKSPKLGENARKVFLDKEVTLVIPTIVLAEIKYLYKKQRFRTSLEKVFQVIENDPRCLATEGSVDLACKVGERKARTVYPMNVEVVEVLPISLNIHDAIIVGTAFIFKNIYLDVVKVITKDDKIVSSGLIETIW